MNLIVKALADPTRRQLLQLLRKKPMNASKLAEHFPIAKSTLSAALSGQIDRRRPSG